METSTPPPLPVRPSRARLWPWIVGPALVVLVALAIWSLDEPPPDVSDLVFEPLQLTDEENAYVQLTQVAQLLARLTPDESLDELEDFSSGKEWDDAKVTAWLSPLDTVWPQYEAAAKISRSQGRILTSPDTLVPEIGQMMELARFSVLRARSLLKKDRPDDALRIAVTSLEAGRLLQESRSSLICYLTGVAIQTQAFILIQHAGRHPDVSTDALRESIAALERNRVGTDALGYAFRSELQFYDGAISMLAREHAGGRMALAVPGLYKPNKTRRIYAELLRESLRVIGRDIHEINQAKHNTQVLFNQLRHRSPENFVGRILLNIIVPTFSSITERHSWTATQVSMTQALLAVRIHEKEKGELPASLAELTPAILPGTPKDYYDHTDIKYSREFGFIWSVGRDNLVITSADQVIDKFGVTLRIRPKPPEPEETLDGIFDR
ncbi:MAG: hypothetical protein K0R17_177 [Rariglobus sp.]|jgi:hypothetical protein|nr:hypothetical protein [Rariglobus sp.]